MYANFVTNHALFRVDRYQITNNVDNYANSLKYEQN